MSIENVRVCAGAVASTLRFEGYPVIAEEFEALAAAAGDRGKAEAALHALVEKSDIAAFEDVRIRSMPLPRWWRWLADLRQSCEAELRHRAERAAAPRPTSVVAVPRTRTADGHILPATVQTGFSSDIDAIRDDRRLMAAGGMMLVSTSAYSVAMFAVPVALDQHLLLVVSGIAAFAASLLTGMSVFGRRRRTTAMLPPSGT